MGNGFYEKGLCISGGCSCDMSGYKQCGNHIARRKHEFQKNIDSWSNHRYLLWPALEATKHIGLPVLELGCGNGSTPYLQQYCQDNGLELISYDFNKEWADKFGAIHVTDWDGIDWDKKYSVVLVDESPGEHRKISIRNLVNNALIVVVHDSEPKGWNASDYQVREEFPAYKFFHDMKPYEPEYPWATALSNFINVTEFNL